jgi:uncharacterized protein (DUF1800 family)
MMVYLNIDGSQKGAANENYARELMELFSLGAGNFSEQDVREAARAFTGWQVQRNRDGSGPPLGEAIFRPPRFDSGTKVFLGRSGNFGPDEIIDIIVQQPASAEYITRRLFSFFIYPEPDQAELAPFVDVYNGSERSIGAVVQAMLRSEVFYSRRAYRALVKSPIEYAVGAVKSLGLQREVPQLLPSRVGQPRDGGVLGQMGQIPFDPPNVAGWPGNAAWLNSTTLFARLNFINQLTGGAPPARGVARQLPAQPPLPSGSLGTTANALAYYLPLVLDDNLPAEATAALIEFSGGPDATLSPEQLRGLVYLVLGSPQFHLS